MHDLVSNKRATHDYAILETFEAGIALLGTEIKSLRDNGGSLQEAYVREINDEVWLIGCTIAPYRYGSLNNHEERRQRKLLLHKREIKKLHEATSIKGLTIIPLAFYLKEGRVKVRIALAKGKKDHDKRHAIRDKEEKRGMAKAMKQHSQQG